MRNEPQGARGLSDSERARLALVRRGVMDLRHDLGKCQREVSLQLEEQMAFLESPLPRALVEAYDEVQRTALASRHDLEACEEELVSLINRG